MTGQPERIGDSVRRELGRFGPAETMGEIVSVWPEAVGADVAANAWPARLARDGTLHVAVSSSVWAFELTQLEALIRARVSERLGNSAPPSLRFAVGRLPDPGAEAVETSTRTVPRVSAEAREAGEKIAAAVEDSDLRGAVARAAAASLAAGRGRADDRPL